MKEVRYLDEVVFDLGNDRFVIFLKVDGVFNDDTVAQPSWISPRRNGKVVTDMETLKDYLINGLNTTTVYKYRDKPFSSREKLANWIIRKVEKRVPLEDSERGVNIYSPSEGNSFSAAYYIEDLKSVVTMMNKDDCTINVYESCKRHRRPREYKLISLPTYYVIEDKEKGFYVARSNRRRRYLMVTQYQDSALKFPSYRDAEIHLDRISHSVIDIDSFEITEINEPGKVEVAIGGK